MKANRSALVAFALGLALASQAHAQVQGVVVTGAGPLPCAAIELGAMRNESR